MLYHCESLIRRRFPASGFSDRRWLSASFFSQWVYLCLACGSGKFFDHLHFILLPFLGFWLRLCLSLQNFSSVFVVPVSRRFCPPCFAHILIVKPAFFWYPYYLLFVRKLLHVLLHFKQRYSHFLTTANHISLVDNKPLTNTCSGTYHIRQIFYFSIRQACCNAEWHPISTCCGFATTESMRLSLGSIDLFAN